MTTDEIATTLKQADEAVLEEILREAEARLSAQLIAAIAADQRAMTFLGFLGAITVFLLGAAIAALTAQSPSTSIAAVAALGAVGFVGASCLAYQAWKPIDFEFVGNDPSSWLGDIAGGVKLAAAKAEQCAFYDAMLKDNRKAMERSGRWLTRSVWTAAATVGICAATAIAKLFLGGL
jgi:hypothetical protein